MLGGRTYQGIDVHAGSFGSQVIVQSSATCIVMELRKHVQLFRHQIVSGDYGVSEHHVSSVAGIGGSSVAAAVADGTSGTGTRKGSRLGEWKTRGLLLVAEQHGHEVLVANFNGSDAAKIVEFDLGSCGGDLDIKLISGGIDLLFHFSHLLLEVVEFPLLVQRKRFGCGSRRGLFGGALDPKKELGLILLKEFMLEADRIAQICQRRSIVVRDQVAGDDSLFVKAVKIQLPNEACELGVLEVLGKDGL